MMERLNELYREDIPTIVDEHKVLNPESREILFTTCSLADKLTESVTVFTSRPKYNKPTFTRTPLYIDPIEPDENGIINGYTNGEIIGVNPYIVPKTNLFYKFTKKLKESRNPFAKYLIKKLERPVENLLETIVHEKLHVETQLKEMYVGDGRKTTFINDVYQATIEYLEEKLKAPKAFKPFIKYFAKKLVIPAVEGLNQLATRKVLKEAKHTYEENTTYDLYGLYTELAANALEAQGIQRPIEFYRQWIERGYKTVKDFVSNFLEAIKNYNGSRYAYA
ncbi:MAG: hypothetical protein QW051_04460 [Candidatus Aenigmatarchaeota archaeon]